MEEKTPDLAGIEKEIELATEVADTSESLRTVRMGYLGAYRGTGAVSHRPQPSGCQEMMRSTGMEELPWNEALKRC